VQILFWGEKNNFFFGGDTALPGLQLNTGVQVVVKIWVSYYWRRIGLTKKGYKKMKDESGAVRIRPRQDDFPNRSWKAQFRNTSNKRAKWTALTDGRMVIQIPQHLSGELIR